MIKEILWFPSNKCFIDGNWIEPQNKKYIQLYNPSNGEFLTEISRGTKADINLAVRAAEKSIYSNWGKAEAVDRGRILRKMSNLILKNIDKLALIESIDVGKPLDQSKSDAIALARYLEFYGGASDKIHGTTIPFKKDFLVYSIREPLGVTAHIIPWNYPMQIIGRSIGASLAMGNACILKPAEEACLTALAFGAIAKEAGLPDGALNIIPGYGKEAGKALSSHQGVNFISFTGSFRTGTKVQASAAKNVTGTTLELGGKSPQLVFNDCNIERAIPFLVKAGIQNAGQTCSASSRILVQEELLSRVTYLMGHEYKKLRVGPAIKNLEVGPVISKKQQTIVEGYLEAGSDLQILSTGSLNNSKDENGFYCTPTLFMCDDPSHILAQEEIFGPIQILIPFKDEEDAINIANSTNYGLVASIWSENGARQMRLAKAIKAGQIFINNYGAGGGIELPFGGIGRSGHGREKGYEALFSFSQIKTVASFHG